MLTRYRYLTPFNTAALEGNPDKTQFLLILYNNTLTQPHYKLFINNNISFENHQCNIIELNRVSPTDEMPAIKYLGVYFDQSLNFKFHICQICKKCSHALYSLRQVKNILPPSALRTLYYSLFHCHLVYAVKIWSSVPTSPLLSKQKATIKLISNKPYNAHTEPLFKALSILPLSYLITYAELKFFHSFHHQTIPAAFNGTWHTALEQCHLDGSIQHLLNLRNNDDYYSPPSRTTFISRFPLFSLPSLWNNLPNNLKELVSKNSFSFNLKKHFVDLLNLNPICKRLLCPACLGAGLVGVRRSGSGQMFNCFLFYLSIQHFYAYLFNYLFI